MSTFSTSSGVPASTTEVVFSPSPSAYNGVQSQLTAGQQIGLTIGAFVALGIVIGLAYLVGVYVNKR